MFTNFYIQKQTTIKCSKHFHIRDQACPVWIKLIYNTHTALINTTPKIKHLSTNKAYFHSIIPFSHILNAADETITQNTKQQVCFVRGFGVSLKVKINEDDNNAWVPSKLRSFLNKCWRKTFDCGFIWLQGILGSMYTKWQSYFHHSICNTTLPSLHLNILYWHLLTLPYNGQTGQNGPVKCTSFLFKRENTALPGVAWWLRHCATSRMVPGSNPGGVTGFFSDIFLLTVPWPRRSTQSLVKMSTRNISWGVKVAGAWGWQPHHLHVLNVMEIWEPKPPGTLWATPRLLWDSFTFYIYIYKTRMRVCSSGLWDLRLSQQWQQWVLSHGMWHCWLQQSGFHPHEGTSFHHI